MRLIIIRVISLIEGFIVKETLVNVTVIYISREFPIVSYFITLGLITVINI